MPRSTALVTADFAETANGSRLNVTVQLSPLDDEMEQGYRQGFGAGLDTLSAVAERMTVLQRFIKAPRSVVWEAWVNEGTLPQ